MGPIASLKFLCLSITITTISSLEFNRTYVGVTNNVFIKRAEWNETSGKNEIPNWKSYSLRDVVTMMTVISTKFTRVATFGVAVDNVAYKPNLPPSVLSGRTYTPEAAAHLNQGRRKHVIDLIQGIWMSFHVQQFQTETLVAMEKIRLANQIYPGTVTGVVFSGIKLGSDLQRTQQTFVQLQRVEREVHGMGLLIGTRQPDCKGIVSSDPSIDEQVQHFRRRIVSISDFIICQYFPANVEANLAGPENATRVVQQDLLRFREEVVRLNPRLEVMGETMWSSGGNFEWHNLENLKQHWVEMNEFAVRNRITIWLHAAFDEPWTVVYDPTHPYAGWWRLRANKDIDKLSGYVEKINDNGADNGNDYSKKGSKELSLNPLVYPVIVLVILFAIFVISMNVFALYKRVSNLQNQLNKQEIDEFWNGISEETAAQLTGSGGQGAVEGALKVPYNRTYDITKDTLKINMNQLLGSGAFGEVYKATQYSNGKEFAVAVKMTKQNCPKTALKNLLSEIKILSYLGKHPHIVSIMGAYTAELQRGVVYLATELCDLGSLKDFLTKGDKRSGSDNDYQNDPNCLRSGIQFQDMVRWSLEIAHGMEFLSGKHVVHADLATRNVLLTAEKTAKITDFGLSRRLYDYTNYIKTQQEPLPWRWMAIESLQVMEFSSKSDVWSYGVTLWEIFSMGDVPYPGLSWTTDFVDSLLDGLRMNCPPHATQEIYRIMVNCWHMEASGRPTFTNLKETTGQILDKLEGGNHYVNN